MQKQQRNAVGGEETGACLDDEILYKYFEGLLSRGDRRRVETHLNSCPGCFDELSELKRSVLSPVTAAETERLASMKTLSREEQVAQILAYVEQECPAIDTDEISKLDALGQKIKALFSDSGITFEKLLKPAIVCIALFLLVQTIGRPIYVGWRSDELAKSGLSSIVEKYEITSRDELRPTGGFRYSEFSETRTDESNSVYETARVNLEKALELDAENEMAHHYLGTYYLLIENDPTKAKSQFLLVLAHDSTNAAVLNDLGIVAFGDGVYQEAEEKFILALKRNPRLLEAQYNLATLYQHQGKIDAARKEWAKYLDLDPAFNWAEVARNRIELLQQKQ